MHSVSITMDSAIRMIEKEHRLQMRCDRGAKQALAWCIRTIENQHQLQMRCDRGARQALERCIKTIEKEHRLQLRCEQGARQALERCIKTIEKEHQLQNRPKIPETWDCGWSAQHSRWYYWRIGDASQTATWTQPELTCKDPQGVGRSTRKSEAPGIIPDTQCQGQG